MKYYMWQTERGGCEFDECTLLGILQVFYANNNIDIQRDGCFVWCRLVLGQMYKTGYLRALGSKYVNQYINKTHGATIKICQSVLSIFHFSW